MRKFWLFLLCMACMICMGGLCMAKENGENWVRYYRSDYYTCKVDTNSIKVREHNGRKYLEASIKYDRSKMLLALDIENQWYIILEGYNHVTGKKRTLIRLHFPAIRCM